MKFAIDFAGSYDEAKTWANEIYEGEPFIVAVFEADEYNEYPYITIEGDEGEIAEYLRLNYDKTIDPDDFNTYSHYMINHDLEV